MTLVAVVCGVYWGVAVWQLLLDDYQSTGTHIDGELCEWMRWCGGMRVWTDVAVWIGRRASCVECCASIAVTSHICPARVCPVCHCSCTLCVIAWCLAAGG
jgi:hypothetical protein